MDDAFSTQSKLKTSGDYKEALARLSAEMERLETMMDKNRAEVERLKIETSVIKAKTSLNLDRLQAQVNSWARAK